MTNHVIYVAGSDAARVFGYKVDRPSIDTDYICDKAAALAHLNLVKSEISDIKLDPSGNYIYAKTANMVLEFELAWSERSASSLIKILEENPALWSRVEGDGIEWRFLHPDVLLALKLTHRYKKNSPHFLKTMRDIQMFRAGGATVPSVLKKWMKEREKETYNYKHPKLMGVKKGDFFNDDGINYVYDHDSIHEAIAVMGTPAYTRFQPEGEEVGTSKKAFFECPKSVQLLAVLEEAYVLSLERSIIPFGTKDDSEKCKYAFDVALSKVCTSITSGWFREFAWENFDLVNQLYDQEYVHRFYRAVEAGHVKPYIKPMSDSNER